MRSRARLARSPRALLRHPVYVSPLDASVPPRRLIAEDISLGGMFVRCGDELPEGTLVTVDFEVHGLPVPFARGRVLWQRADLVVEGRGRWRPPGFAVVFFPVTRRARALLERLVLGVSSGLEAESAPGPSV